MLNKHPSREECLVLLKKYNTPDHVIRHCIKVADTALKISRALNDKGCRLDLDLIQAAGLLHDIARVEDKHWEIGAQIASAMGYEQEAEIIRGHMFYQCNPNETEMNETDIICLSDRMVKEDEYVGLNNRMQYILDKFKENQDAVDRINQSIKNNKAMITRIEMRIGSTIDSLISK